MRTKKNQAGIATIPIVIAFMILVIALALGLTTISFNEVYVSREYVRSSQALVYAEAGARDALIKTAREGRFVSAGYDIEFVTDGCTSDTGCATVTVTLDSEPPSSISKTITSEGRVGNYIRTVQVTVDLDNNWVITDTTWQEVTS